MSAIPCVCVAWKTGISKLMQQYQVDGDDDDASSSESADSEEEESEDEGDEDEEVDATRAPIRSPTKSTAACGWAEGDNNVPVVIDNGRSSIKVISMFGGKK